MESLKNNRLTALLAIIILLMVSGFLALQFWEPEPIVISTTGTIGVIEVQGAITDSHYTYILSSAVEEALLDDTVKAVVLEIDSPGGSAYLIEQVYLDLLELKTQKPVVASCSMALSGGYYIAVSADYIYAPSSAMVGNVGVIGTGPGWIIPSEITLETGPHKITGYSAELFPFNLTSVLGSFTGAVVEGRGDRLLISLDELTMGSVWMGSEAKNKGIVDELGSTQAAIRYAASVAGLDEYNVESLVARVANDTLAIDVMYPSIEELNEQNPPPAVYYLYMPGDIYMQSGGAETINVTFTGPLSGDVIVDVSHGNQIGPWILDRFTAELVKKGLYVGYSASWVDLEEALNETRAVVIATPTEYYTQDEYETLDRWVKDGGILIFLGDASADFLELPVLQGPLNSMSDHWGLHYTNGYLYDQEHYYGFYRNIVVDYFKIGTLFEDVDEVVFFTAGSVESSIRWAARTSETAYNSVSERPDRYSTVAYYSLSDGVIIAFGDISWMMDPFINAADNSKLLENLVTVISETQ